MRALECLRFGTAIELPVSVCLISFKFELPILSTNWLLLNAQILDYAPKRLVFGIFTGGLAVTATPPTSFGSITIRWRDGEPQAGAAADEATSLELPLNVQVLKAHPQPDLEISSCNEAVVLFSN